MNENTNAVQDSSYIEIDLLKLFRGFFRVAKRVWLIFPLVILLFASIGGYVTAISYSPEYTSSATYAITLEDLPDNYYGQTAAKTLVATFPYILQSSDLNTLVCEDMGVEELENTVIGAEVLGDTNVVTVYVTSDTSEKAYTTLSSVIKLYPDIAIHVVGSTTMNLIINPTVPVEPSNEMNLVRNMLICALAGFALVVAGVCLAAMVRPTLSDAEEIKKVLRLEHVAAFPEIKMSGRNQVLNIKDKTVNRSFYDAVGRLRTTVTHTARKKEIKTVLVTSALQGEGKSTVAVNLALSMANHGLKTMLIDCDLRNPSVAEVMEYKQLNASISQAIRGEVKLSAAVIRENPYLDVICEKAYNDDAAELVTSDFIKRLVKAAGERYDYVIIDTPPLTAASDAVTLGDITDGFIYVIKQDYAPSAVVLDNLEKFRYGKAKPICAVMNTVKGSLVSSGYGNYRYGSYRYGR